MIVSKSEWGSYRYDGDTDMKVLRKKAENAVRYFRTHDPKMETIIFGCPVSVIENGKLVDKDHVYKGNIITRALQYQETGYFAGRLTLSYNDSYNDGRGEGGSGAVILGDVRDVRIEGDHLVIEGVDGSEKNRRTVSYRYRIQDYPDSKPFTKPIPKGGKIPEAKPIGASGGTKSEDVPRKESPKPAPRKEAPKAKPAPRKGSVVSRDVTPLDYGGPRLTIEGIASRFSSPVRCTFLNRNTTVWVSMQYPAKGMSGWVNTESYRIVDGEKRYGMGTYPATNIESDGTYLRIQGTDSVLWYRIEEASSKKEEGTLSISELASKLHALAVIMDAKGYWHAYPYTGERMPVYTAGEIMRKLKDPDGCAEICAMYLDCELSHYSEFWNHWSEYGTTYEEWKGIERTLKAMRKGNPVRARPVPKPPVPVEKPVKSKPVSKPAPKAKSAPKPKPAPKPAKARPVERKPVKKGTTVYEVRVDGRVEGEFSSKSKAEALKKQLKANGSKARIHVVFA